ncbi:hypothetical protein LOTGIDRAFT_139895 [Lottia gigantea]|uniref:Sulfatase-modifying factor enzyme-like domain-containing protein n=1 Tax=Lottia gigantea TaxID=225164 RepID=V4CGB4_LOTGI|nr:hypothetical protein LOTGIDRAFT_139895 [Lottia gigantea]ESP01110.1 hypothetical protein LOTGIDRAFT_139895 [Lottia gigantea]
MQDYKKYKAMRVVSSGEFYMGINDPKSQTGEHPLRKIKYKSFYIDSYPVTNAEYWEFRRMKWRYRATSEKKGWSWVLSSFVPDDVKEKFASPVSDVTNYLPLQPFGPGSDLHEKWNHPVTHVSYDDARIYCNYRGHRLPTEIEWEAAARGTGVAEDYPWGNMWEKFRMNEWQGGFPEGNLKLDGYESTSPVDAYYPQNHNYMYDFLGNVWEWTGTQYYERMIPDDLQPQMLVLKGGSYIDSRDGSVNMKIRTSQRKGEEPDHTAGNVGFRCAMNAHHFDIGDAQQQRKSEPKEPAKPKVYRTPKAKPKEKEAEKNEDGKNFGPPQMGVHPKNPHQEL